MSSVDLTNWETPPPNISCPNCGKEWGWEWFSIETSTRTIARWAYPPIRPLDPPIGGESNPTGCPKCEDELRAKGIKAHLDKRLAIADIPKRHRDASFERMEWQHETEHPEDFHRRIMEEKRMGFFLEDADDMRKVFAWMKYIKNPTEYKRRPGLSLWIHGEPGTGKSTIMAAIIRRLLSADGGTGEATVEEYAEFLAKKWDEPIEEVRRALQPWPETGAGSKIMRGGTQIGVKWMDEEMLVEAQRLSWKGQPSELYRAAKVPLLFLDDFHRMAPEKGANSFHAECMSKVICARYRNRLPTVISSNLNPECRVDDAGRIDRTYPGLAGSGYGKRVQRRVDEIFETVWVNANGKRWEDRA